MLSSEGKKELRWIMQFQWMFSMTLSGLVWLLFSRKLAVAVGCGALVSVLPSLVFAKLLFRHQGARKAREIVHAFYVGEALKIGLTLFLVAGVMFWVHPVWWAFFMGFALTQLSSFFSPAVYSIQRT